MINNLLLNQDFAVKNPIEYNNLAIKYFNSKYGIYIKDVFKKIENNDFLINAEYTRNIYNDMRKEKIKRHLFPFFSAASFSGGIRQEHTDFCVGYVSFISLPVLMIDNLIDKKIDSRNLAEINDTMLISMISIYNGIFHICNVPNSIKLLKPLSNNYSQIFQSLLNEIHLNRFNIESINNPENCLNRQLNSQNSELTCKYFNSSIVSALLINNIELNSSLIDFSNCFGKFRQLVDQIADVREDILIGKLTIPVLLALKKDKSDILKNLIFSYWATNQKIDISDNSESIISIVENLGGFDESYKLAIGIYNYIMQKYSNLPLNIKNEEMKILLILKRAFLERLMMNGWKDIPNYY